MYNHPFFAIALVSTIALLLNWQFESYFHERRLQNKRFRIHVNGIRGKSTVARLIAGIFRAADIKTIAKTTGSAACVIDPNGVDHPIQRNGAPTILEQVKIVQKADKDIEALVIECMAIKPEYQLICENKIVRSNIGIITNVREDHQDLMGETLPEIAISLLSTCPRNGVLITAEQSPELLKLIQSVARQNHTRLIVANPQSVSDQEQQAFSYISFKENVAIGFEVARLVGIDRETALQGMLAAAPDPGVLKLRSIQVGSRKVTWADLFAVNDRESVIAAVDQVASLAKNQTVRIGILNNRADREHRALQFARIAACDLSMDFICLLGAYQKPVESQLLSHGFSKDRIIVPETSNTRTGKQLLSSILNSTTDSDVMLFGMVNIHTRQADLLRDFFEQDAGGPS